MANIIRFQQFDAQQPRKRRAATACVGCHEKRTKCDLLERRNQGYGTCTVCSFNSIECITRHSKRNKEHRASLAVVAPLRRQPQESATATTNLPSPTRIENDYPLSNDHVHPHVSIVEENYREQGEALNELQRSMPSTRNGSSHTVGSRYDPISAQEINSLLCVITASDSANNDLKETYSAQVDRPEMAGSTFKELLDLPPPELQQAFKETFFKYCYTWCPVLDAHTINTDLERSPLLMNALALSASHIQPPGMAHAAPSAYYDRANKLFYGNQETDLVMCLKGIALLYWWSPKSACILHRDSSWWWTTVAIRHAQYAAFHREPTSRHPMKIKIDSGLRRRIWWTLFARERLIALCLGRPCIIDPEDCNIPWPTMSDFEEKNIQAEIFIRWIKLCSIIGKVTKHLQRSSDDSVMHSFPVHLANELIHWVQSHPANTSLHIEHERTTSFNRDVHQLHLPYLSVIIVLHLSHSSHAIFPGVFIAAILAASCTARIFRDFMARGRIRYLAPISCWYCSIALLPLLHARQVDSLASSVDEDIHILVTALEDLNAMWPTARSFLQGFERLRKFYMSEAGNLSFAVLNNDDSHGVDWAQFLPFVTSQTSRLAATLLTDQFTLIDTEIPPVAFQFDELFDPFCGCPDETQMWLSL